VLIGYINYLPPVTHWSACPACGQKLNEDSKNNYFISD
jgi:hypothetical protein